MNKRILLFKRMFLSCRPTVVVLLFTIFILNNVFGKSLTNRNEITTVCPNSYSSCTSHHSAKKVTKFMQMGANPSPLGTASNLFLTLYKSITGTTDYAQADQIKLLVNSSLASNGVGTNKLLNPSDNLAFIEGTKVLAIDGYKAITNKDTITVAVTQLTTSLPYKLKVDATAFSVAGYVPMVLDRLTNTFTSLVADTALISFTPSAATNTFGNRFAIVFKATGLPVQEISLTATQVNTDVLVNWNTIGQTDVISYTIESATNISEFTAVTSINANNLATASYSFTDINSSAIYYRIKATDFTGTISYSNVVVVSGASTAKISAYPNPLLGNTLHISTSNLSAGKYSVRLHNTIGQRVFTSEIVGSENNHNLQIGSLTAGKYILTISREGNIVYNTFIQVK